jgi:hypothetical protein
MAVTALSTFFMSSMYDSPSFGLTRITLVGRLVQLA